MALNSIFVWPGMFSFNGSGVVFTNPVLLTDGSASAPSLALASAPTYGWYNSGSGAWGYSNAGVLAWAFTGGNLVGQGTNSLTVGGGIQATAAGTTNLGTVSGTVNIGDSAFSTTTANISNGSITWAASGSTFTTTGGFAISPTKIITYNGVTTAGWGVPAIQAAATPLTGQIAAVASVSTYTVGAADGSFEISANVNVTAATTAAFGVVITYTDETNTPRSLTLPVVQLAGTVIASITNLTGVGPYEGVVCTIRAKASTAITITTAGTFTSVTYNVSGTIKQVA